MTDDKEGLLRHYRQTREDLLSAIEGLSDALLTEPSLDGWSVKDHLAHIAAWDDIRAERGRPHFRRSRVRLAHDE